MTYLKTGLFPKTIIVRSFVAKQKSKVSRRGERALYKERKKQYLLRGKHNCRKRILEIDALNMQRLREKR